MAAEGSVVKFTSAKDSAQMEENVDFKKDDSVKVFEEFHLPKFYIFNLSFSIFTFVLDLYFHCKLAYVYSKTNQPVYFALTLAFIVFPALITTAFSMRWYIHDEDEVTTGKRPRLWRWGLRLIMLAVQMAPLMRYIDALSYGIRSSIAKKQGNNLKHQEYLRLMLEEEDCASLLRLFPCFLQSSPQTIIQLVFLFTQNRQSQTWYYVAGFQAYSVVISFIAIAWSLTAYHRSVRFVRQDKEKLSSSSAIIMFCWYLFHTLSRILALSLLATLYPSWFGALCLIHWAVMSLWLSLGHHQTAVCTTRCEELIFSSALGLAYIFAFISAKDGPTRYSYLAYYLVAFIENTTALVVWCITGGAVSLYLLYGAVAVQIISFILAITFMITYYKFRHPSGTSTVISKSMSVTAGKPVSL